MSDTTDRTLPATERRRQRAREEGQAPLSREVIAAVGLATAALLIALVVPGQVSSLLLQLRAMLAHLERPPSEALRDAGFALLATVLPLTLTIAAASAASVLIQTGWLVHAGALLPDLGRLNPKRGLKKIFNKTNAVETVKAAVKILITGWAVFHVFSAALPESAAALSWSLPRLTEHLARQVMHIVTVVLAFQVIIAAIDFWWIRFSFAQDLRMSSEDVKQEHKEAEGDPRIKAKIRQIRMARARRRMLAAVSKAAVVVTNPTHYAVALAYERGSASAPKVIAKGIDELAARIREAAIQQGIPLVANPPLARALHSLPLDAEIPSEHFKAVAEIIAYVWRLRRQSSAQA